MANSTDNAAPDTLAVLTAALRASADEVARLRHDIERHVKIASDLATREAKLREALQLAETLIRRLPRNGEHWSLIIRFEAALTDAALAGGSDGK